MIITAFLPPPVFGSFANDGYQNTFHTNYTDLALFANLVRQQAQKEPLPMSIPRPTPRSAHSCACSTPTKSTVSTTTNTGSNSRQRRVSFREPLVSVHEIERIVPERRVRSVSSLEELEQRLVERARQSAASRKPAKEEVDKVEEKRWKMACKLARCVGVAYLVVAFGEDEDDIFEVECDLAGTYGSLHSESLDEVFDFRLLEDHVLV